MSFAALHVPVAGSHVKGTSEPTVATRVPLMKMEYPCGTPG